MIELNKIYKDDVMRLIIQIPDNSVDVIPIDPPYLYLKGQKLEREFDEHAFFQECKRILKKDGFIILFGRGTSFYRWNTILADLGFVFKEEVIWNKRRTTSPALPLGRVHETVSIHTKGGGKIQKTQINYGELKGYDLDKICNDILRLKALFNKGAAYDKVVENIKKIQNGECYRDGNKNQKFKATFSSDLPNKCISTYTIEAMSNGCRDQSIISCPDSHYGNSHPTQKPVRLIERLLKLVIPLNREVRSVAATFFSGSGAHEEACINLGIDFIGCEIDDEYHAAATKRIELITNNLKQQLFT